MTRETYSAAAAAADPNKKTISDILFNLKTSIGYVKAEALSQLDPYLDSPIFVSFKKHAGTPSLINLDLSHITFCVPLPGNDTPRSPRVAEAIMTFRKIFEEAQTKSNHNSPILLSIELTPNTRGAQSDQSYSLNTLTIKIQHNRCTPRTLLRYLGHCEESCNKDTLTSNLRPKPTTFLPYFKIIGSITLDSGNSNKASVSTENKHGENAIAYFEKLLAGFLEKRVPYSQFNLQMIGDITKTITESKTVFNIAFELTPTPTEEPSSPGAENLEEELSTTINSYLETVRIHIDREIMHTTVHKKLDDTLHIEIISKHCALGKNKFDENKITIKITEQEIQARKALETLAPYYNLTTTKTPKELTLAHKSGNPLSTKDVISLFYASKLFISLLNQGTFEQIITALKTTEATQDFLYCSIRGTESIAYIQIILEIILNHLTKKDHYSIEIEDLGNKTCLINITSHRMQTLKQYLHIDTNTALKIAAEIAVLETNPDKTLKQLASPTHSPALFRKIAPIGKKVKATLDDVTNKPRGNLGLN